MDRNALTFPCQQPKPPPNFGSNCAAAEAKQGSGFATVVATTAAAVDTMHHVQVGQVKAKPCW